MAQNDVIIVDDEGHEHHFPAGIDPKKAGAIVQAKLAQDKAAAAGPQQMNFAIVNGRRVPVMDEQTGEPTPQASPLSRLTSNFVDVANPFPMIGGALGAAGHAALHPVDTVTKDIPHLLTKTLPGMYDQMVGASADQFGKSMDAYQQGRYSEAFGHGAAGLLPGIGPAAADTGEQIASGDVAGGIGRGLGMALAPAIARGTGRIISRVARPLTERVMQAAVKPSTTLAKARSAAGYGTKEEIARAVLDEDRMVSRGSLQKAQEALDATDAKAGQRIAAGAGRGQTVDPDQIERAILSTADPGEGNFFGEQINAPPDIAGVHGVAENFKANPYLSKTTTTRPVPARPPALGMVDQATTTLDPIPVDQAHRFMSNTGQALKGQFGRLGGAIVEAQKRGRANVTQQLRNVIPGLDDLWKQEARQITVRDALGEALGRTGNRDVIPFTAFIGAAASPEVAAAAAAERSAFLTSGLARGVNRFGRGRVANPLLRASIFNNLLPAPADEQEPEQ